MLTGFAPSSAVADDPVVARVNGVDIKQSDLDFAASEVGSEIATYSQQDRERMLLQYVIENELTAEAAAKANLDQTENFADRVKYHQRRALRDAYYDADIRDAVTEDAAKKVYDEKIAVWEPRDSPASPPGRH
jgi:peptidyl-prolyl cis-trans isomerase C